jgi:hypothetical protein
LSNELGKRLKVPVIHKDDIYDAVASFVSEHGLRNNICFDVLYRLLQTVIDSDALIILDFRLNNIDDLRRLKDWIEDRDGELAIIHCTCFDANGTLLFGAFFVKGVKFNNLIHMTIFKLSMSLSKAFVVSLRYRYTTLF